MKYLGSIFTIILLLFTENIYAYISFTENGISYYASQATDDNVSIESVDNNYTGSLKIPSSVTYMYKTYQVTSISSNALSGCTGLTKVSIPYTVTRIGTNAFGGCTGLTSIEIPEGVTSIDGSAFKDCTRLTNIVVSKSNKVYDSRDNCNAIIKTATNTLVAGCKNTIIPNSVTNMLVTLLGIIVFLEPITKEFVVLSMIALQLLRLSYTVLPFSTIILVRSGQ